MSKNFCIYLFVCHTYIEGNEKVVMYWREYPNKRMLKFGIKMMCLYGRMGIKFLCFINYIMKEGEALLNKKEDFIAYSSTTALFFFTKFTCM